MSRHSITDTTTAAILARVMNAQEHCTAFLADTTIGPAERKAARASELLLTGLLETIGQDELREAWDAALFTLEALSMSHDSVGVLTRATYRTIYRALSGR